MTNVSVLRGAPSVPYVRLLGDVEVIGVPSLEEQQWGFRTEDVVGVEAEPPWRGLLEKVLAIDEDADNWPIWIIAGVDMQRQSSDGFVLR